MPLRKIQCYFSDNWYDEGLDFEQALTYLLDDAGEEYLREEFTSEEWPMFKHNMEFGVLPVLKINGKQYSQKIAIARYLGHCYGYAGKNIEEDFQIDQIVDYFIDLHASAAAVHYESDESIKAKKNAENSKEKYPTMLEKLNSIITENDGYMACSKLTWADYVFAGALDHLKVMMQAPDLDEKYPNFKTVCELRHRFMRNEDGKLVLY